MAYFLSNEDFFGYFEYTNFQSKTAVVTVGKLDYFLFQHLDTLLPFAQKNKLYFSFFHFISFVLLVALDFIDIEILGAKTWQKDSLFFEP